jgi:hypothetical protein
MSEQKQYIPIWFFVGGLLLFYGLLIMGTGIYEYFRPSEHPVALAHLHAGIWWGALLLVLGIVYCYRFRPGKK